MCVRTLPALEYDVDDGMVDNGSGVGIAGELGDESYAQLLGELEEALFQGEDDPPFDEDDGDVGDGEVLLLQATPVPSTTYSGPSWG